MNIRLILPTMIETDINVWQGCMKFHNVPELIRKYDGQDRLYKRSATSRWTSRGPGGPHRGRPSARERRVLILKKALQMRKEEIVSMIIIGEKINGSIPAVADAIARGTPAS